MPLGGAIAPPPRASMFRPWRRQDVVVVVGDAVATFGVITRRSPVLAFVLACDSAEVFRNNQEHPHTSKGTTLRSGASCCCFGST